MARVRPPSLFIANRRIGTLMNLTYRINTNDTQEFSDAGAFKTEGKTGTEVTADTIVPDTFADEKLIRDALNKVNVDITIFIAGKLHVIKDCGARSIEFAGEMASGKLTGKFEWFGAAPELVG